LADVYRDYIIAAYMVFVITPGVKKVKKVSGILKSAVYFLLRNY